MQGFKNLWLFRFACYAVLLVTSLGVQAARPDLYAMFCTPVPLGVLNPHQSLDLPLNSPMVQPSEIGE